MKKSLQFTLLFLVILGLAGVVLLSEKSSQQTTKVDSFEDCIQAGNPVMESDPRQCRTEDGRLFIEETDGLQSGQTVTREGVISQLDASEMPVDGPMRITMSTDGQTVQIAVPSMGLPTCAASENIVDVFDLAVGERIAVRGQVDASGSIVPCESADHYLRRLEEGAAKATTTLAVGDTEQFRDLSITLDEVVQESRCPVDAECIEGGAVTVKTTLSFGTSSKTVNIASDDAPAVNTHFEYAIGITNVQPPLQSGEEIPQDAYRITFSLQQQ